MIYVTHDQTEALTFADKVVVMYEGEVVQIGTPEELFERPKHTFVGYFIGSPGMNVLSCRLADGVAFVGGQRLPLPPGLTAAADARTQIGVRPEFVRVVPAGTHGALPITIDKVEDIGSSRIVRSRLGDEKLTAVLTDDAPVPALSLIHI